MLYENLINDVCNIANFPAHDAGHIRSVIRLATRFAEHTGADMGIVTLIAALHDVEDYKSGLFPGKQLSIQYFLDKHNIPKHIQDIVVPETRAIGYVKRKYDNIQPSTIEGKIVSDADFCDIVGARGILRMAEWYHDRKKPFFDPSEWPQERTKEEYKACKAHAVQHIFEKAFCLEPYIYTAEGRKEYRYRKEMMEVFLNHFFDETDVPEWKVYLNNYFGKH